MDRRRESGFAYFKVFCFFGFFENCVSNSKKPKTLNYFAFFENSVDVRSYFENSVGFFKTLKYSPIFENSVDFWFLFENSVLFELFLEILWAFQNFEIDAGF